MVKNNDKGFITWLFTIITLVISVLTLIGSWSGFGAVFSEAGFDDFGAIILLIWGIIQIFLMVYLLWHGTLIILGKASNTWTFVAAAFLGAALIGGILMLIAKILN